MTVSLIRMVIGVHVVTTVAYVLTAALTRQPRLPRSAAVWIARSALLASILLPLVSALVELPRMQPLSMAPVQVWSGGATAARPASNSPPARITAAGLRYAETHVLSGAVLIVAVLVAACALRSVNARRRLAIALRSSRAVRRVGRVELRVASRASMPFAMRLSGRAYVVLDETTFARRIDRYPALHHELTHHRHGDALLALPLLVVTTLLLPNPLAFAWVRLVRSLEEQSVDAAVVRMGVAVRAYVECLLRIASRPSRCRTLTSDLTALGPSARSLQQRIVTMTHRSKPISRQGVTIAVLVLAALLTAAACASSELVGDRRVSIDDVRLAAAAASDEKLAIEADPLIVDEVNRLVATPEGRAFTKRALGRMKSHAAFVQQRLEQAQLPRQLSAVPIVESGYANLGAPSSGGQNENSLAPGIPGRGLWMFIPATARAYGLHVDDVADERLDFEKETDAAMRLLGDLVLAFGDVRLALAAYNQGERHVRDAIAREGTRDAWELVRRGALNKYSPRVYAAAIVMNRPELVD